jgi:hypothetical protein
MQRLVLLESDGKVAKETLEHQSNNPGLCMSTCLPAFADSACHG